MEVLVWNRPHVISCAAAGLLIALTSGCSKTPTGWQGDWPVMAYHGRLADHPRTEQIGRDVRAALEPASRRVSEALGITVVPGRYRFGFRAREGGGTETRARTLISTDGGPVAIELRLEPLLFGTATVDELLAHELTHAALSSELGDQYRALPKWLDEGLAIFAAGQTKSKIRHAIAWTRRDRATAIIDGLATRRKGWIDAAEDALAIEYLRDLSGAGGVPRLVNALRGGAVWQAALEQTTGLEYAAFSAEARSFSRSQIEDRVGDTEEAFRSAVSLFEDDRFEASLSLLEELFVTPDHPYYAPSLYYAGRAWLALGHAADAALSFSSLLDRRRLDIVPLASTLFWAAQAHARNGDESRAVLLCAELIAYDPFREAYASPCEKLVSGVSSSDEFAHLELGNRTAPAPSER